MPLPLHERTMADTTSSPPRAGDTLQRLSDAGAELHHPQVLSRSNEDQQVSSSERQDGAQAEQVNGAAGVGGTNSGADVGNEGAGSGDTGREDTRSKEEKVEAEKRYEEAIEEEYAKREGGA